MKYYYLVITKLLDLLDKLPYRTRFGLSLGTVLKLIYYDKFNKKRCLCGGYIITYGVGQEGWVTECSECENLIDED